MWACRRPELTNEKLTKTSLTCRSIGRNDARIVASFAAAMGLDFEEVFISWAGIGKEDASNIQAAAHSTTRGRGSRRRRRHAAATPITAIGTLPTQRRATGIAAKESCWSLRLPRDVVHLKVAPTTGIKDQHRIDVDDMPFL